MKNNFLASVIIPSYNSIKTIPYTIEHLLKQDCLCRISEIIIVDSSDDRVTKEYLNSLNNGIIKVITSGIKVMPAVQRNIGAEEAKGDLLIFIDSDAFPSEKWLKKILSAYADGWIAGGGSYLLPDFQKENKIAIAQYYFEFGGFHPNEETKIRTVMPSCNMFCDRTFFLRIGGFPHIRAAEDSLFCLTISKQIKMIFISDAPVYHIFKENINDFISNQILIGKHNYILHKNYYNRFCLRPSVFNLMLPFLIFYKFLIKFSLVFKCERSEAIMLVKSIKYFYIANLSWFKGFTEGKNEPVNSILINRRQRIKSSAISEQQFT